MKRLIVAVGLSVIAFSASALEIGAPFEQLNIDRALPNLPGQAVQYAASGATRSAAASETGESPFAYDHNVIAPAQ
jgi:hypothetical protein